MLDLLGKLNTRLVEFNGSIRSLFLTTWHDYLRPENGILGLQMSKKERIARRIPKSAAFAAKQPSGDDFNFAGRLKFSDSDVDHKTFRCSKPKQSAEMPHYGTLLVLISLPALYSIPMHSGTKFEGTDAAQADLITDLPGLPAGVNFRMFSGLIRVDGRRSLFYWFVESTKSPKDDPLVLWTNGGPGCSGLGGFLTEQGPFRPNIRGSLDLNPYAWNKIANMIFIEQPAGVGFSPIEGNFTYDDTTTAIDNYRFVLGFLDRFPEYKSNDFYITSESYGGHYLPSLAMQLVQNGGVNFRGFAVGNPLTYMPYRDFGQYATFAGHQLLPKPLWDSYLRTGCAMVQEELKADEAGPRVRKESCSALTDEMDRLTEGLDPYGIDFPVCNAEAGPAGRAQVRALLRKVRSASGRPFSGYFPPRYIPCEDGRAAAYLNRPEVQEAIHVGRRVVWCAAPTELPPNPRARCHLRLGNTPANPHPPSAASAPRRAADPALRAAQGGLQRHHQHALQPRRRGRADDGHLQGAHRRRRPPHPRLLGRR